MIVKGQEEQENTSYTKSGVRSSIWFQCVQMSHYQVLIT
jgi:hypothetical protein